MFNNVQKNKKYQMSLTDPVSLLKVDEDILSLN
jgi:hypothetical protein